MTDLLECPFPTCLEGEEDRNPCLVPILLCYPTSGWTASGAGIQSPQKTLAFKTTWLLQL